MLKVYDKIVAKISGKYHHGYVVGINHRAGYLRYEIETDTRTVILNHEHVKPHKGI